MGQAPSSILALAFLFVHAACLPDPDFGTDSATGSGSGSGSASSTGAPSTSGTSTPAPTTGGSGSDDGSTSTGPVTPTTTSGDSTTTSGGSSTTGELLTPTCSGLLGDGKPWGRCPCDPGFECRVTAGGSVCVAACDATPCEFPGCFNGTCNVEQCVWPCDEPGDCLIEGTSCDLGASPPICTYA